MNNILVVGGTWSLKGENKKSKIVDVMFERLSLTPDIVNNYTLWCKNGGNYNELDLNQLKNCVPAILLWAPNVEDDVPKIDIKQRFPEIILITTKRNVDKKYSFQDIVAHGLSKKSNLMIEIQRENDRYVGRLIDPLGNQWFPTESAFTDDFEALAVQSIRRAIYLSKITRQSAVRSPEAIESVPDTPEIRSFLAVVKKSADTFHNLIEPSEHIERFLGNASFRCTRGFPSMKLPDGRIYVSRRNVDKRCIDRDAFVQVGLNRQVGTTDSGKSIVWYRGDHKPSVDTPIQLRLYEQFENTNYMIHSHVYVEDAPFTERMIPCGGVEEAWLITKLAYKRDLIKSRCCAINLIGHGSIVFMRTPSDIDEFVFEKRPSPEIHSEH